MQFTDRQEILWDDVEDLKLRRRDNPLDGHPQEWYSKHYIIKLTTILGREFYLWNNSPCIWTEDIEGAYRYSSTPFGRHARDVDLNESRLNAEERGVDSKIQFEIVDGQQDLLKRKRIANMKPGVQNG